MALYHKRDVKNDFACVLQFFSLISYGLGSVSCVILSEFHFNKFFSGMRFFSAKSAKLASLFGTVEFLAPEMIECTYATFASDAWSVGVLSYMLVTGGKSPFYAGNRFKTVSIKPIPSLCFISNV